METDIKNRLIDITYKSELIRHDSWRINSPKQLTLHF